MLSQPPGGSGCVSRRKPAGCAAGRALVFTHAVAVSPDARSLYAASTEGQVAVFARSPG
jgi:hypothetical protein